MKNLYIIASAAAKRMETEQFIWNALREKGWRVFDIHELPRISQNDIAVTNARIARVIKNRFPVSEKQVVIICLIPTIDTLVYRLNGFSDSVISDQFDSCQSLAKHSADACFCSDDLRTVTSEIIRFIESKEAELL